jgi:hypothetical protein
MLAAILSLFVLGTQPPQDALVRDCGGEVVDGDECLTLNGDRAVTAIKALCVALFAWVISRLYSWF